jgi:mevalonate kinase
MTSASFGHGKVILLGEHSVVHDRPALALSVERGSEVTFSPVAAAADRTRLHIEPWQVDVDTGHATNVEREPLQQALRIARAFYPDRLELQLHATMRLPSGAGMGSSAALGVAVLRALDQARGLTRPDQEIYQRSLDWERVFHGNPSGVDNAMATYGGMALFKRGEPLTRVVPRQPVSLVVAYSGVSSSTKLMVDSVADQLAREPKRMNEAFDEIADLVLRGKRALEQGELHNLGQLMTMNHQLLRSMKLSTDALEEMIAAALAAGSLGAKVTGAGGGGCMVALVDTAESKRAVSDALQQLGKTVYEVESGT